MPTCQTLKRISGLPPGPVPTTQRSDSSPARQIIAIDTIIEQFRKNALTPALRGYGDAREVAPAPDAPAPEGVVDLAPPGTTPTSTGVVAAADAQ